MPRHCSLTRPIAKAACRTQRDEFSLPHPLSARPTVQAMKDRAVQLNARPANRAGLPDRLKQGMEALSGIALDDVTVHRNSPRPAQLQALAFAQGTDIHLAPGQEQHLPHEAWHVVQQKQGRVQPTLRSAGAPINDDAALEAEADAMGVRAGRLGPQSMDTAQPAAPVGRSDAVAQRVEVDVKRSQKLIKDSEGGGLSGTTFEWDSKFEVTIQNDKVVVTIRIKANIEEKLFKEVWANQVAKQWGSRFMLQFDGKNYPIVVQLVQVTQGEHYPIPVSNAESALGSGARGHFGTENMTTWGKHDTTNISHEVGHMLGNVDEYGIVEANGTQRDYLTTPSTTIMAASRSNPVTEHYDLIKQAAEEELNKGRKLAASGKVLPYVERLGGTTSGYAVSMQNLLGVKLKSSKPLSESDLSHPNVVQHPHARQPSPKPVSKSGLKSSKDVGTPEIVAPTIAKPTLKSPPKTGKTVVEQPSELDQVFARRRQDKQTSSAPVIEPNRSMPKQGGAQVQPPQKLAPKVVTPQPQNIVPQVKAPKPVLPEIETSEPRRELTESQIERGRDIIRECYQEALGHAADYEDKDALSERITARFKRIAASYNAADKDAPDFVEKLQACVGEARDLVTKLAA